MLSTERINAHSWWISVFEPLPHERQDLIQKYEVTKELLDYAIDPVSYTHLTLPTNSLV